MNIFYAVIILLCIIAFTCGLWVGGICIFSTFGYCFAGFIMLCYYIYFAHKRIKVFFGNVLKRTRRLYTIIMHWLSAHKNVIYWSCFVLSVVGGLLALYFFTDIFAVIARYLKQHHEKDDIGVVTSIAIGTIISIMSIAFPVLVTVIHNLSNRYQNNYVVTEFRNNQALISFKNSLYISLVLSCCWIVCYYSKSYFCSNLIMFLLLIATMALIICLLLLIWRIIDFMTPNKLIDIIKSRIKSLTTPYYYFDRRVYRPLYAYDSKEEIERMQKIQCIENYDAESTRLYSSIACIYALFRNDMIVRKNIENFWKEMCRKASYITKEETKYYTNCYYNFIYEAIDYAIEHNDPATQNRVMYFMDTLLNSHLGEPRKYREPESEIHKKKYGLSWETIECLWISMQKSVNCPNESMFREYWQIAYNFYSRKYHEDYNMLGGCPIIDKIDNNEQHLYYAIHYLGCSYLIGRKKYNLLDYALNYSQCMPFKWYLMPDNALDVIKTYTAIKEWHSDLNNNDRFSLSNSHNLYDEMITSRPIEQFTYMLLLILWNDNVVNTHIYLQRKWNQNRHLNGLIGLVQNTTNETDWVKYFHLEGSLINKESIVKWLSQHKQD